MGSDRIVDEPKIIIIADASALIDYYKADAKIFPLISQCIGPLVIPRQALEEVHQIEEIQTSTFGISVIDPDLSQLAEAGTRGGPLLRTDRLILALARDRSYVCWTNDSKLRKKCIEGSIRVFWGLEIMLPLCEGGHLSEKAALRVGKRISEINPFYITDKILIRFEKRVRSIFE